MANANAGAVKNDAPAPKTVKATVRDGNRYGAAMPGEVVEVEPAELELCRGALIGPDEAAKIVETAKAKEDGEAERLRILDERRTSLFAAREAQREGSKLAKERKIERLMADVK